MLSIDHPNNAYLYSELFLQYKFAQLNDKANAIADKGIKLFPDFLHPRFVVGHAVMLDQDIEKGFDLLSNHDYLNQAFPHCSSFSESEFMYFYAVLCEYFLRKDRINNAINCGNVLITNVYDYECNENAVMNVCTAVKNKIGNLL